MASSLEPGAARLFSGGSLPRRRDIAGPRVLLVTLEEVAKFIDLMEPWRQAVLVRC
jgi:hypothetical protein